MGYREVSPVKRRYPELCEAIPERYRAYKTEVKRAGEQALREEVRRAALTLFDQGTWPSAPRVAAKLSVPSRMSGETAREALREVQRELRR